MLKKISLHIQKFHRFVKLLFKKISYIHDIFTEAVHSALQMLIKIFQPEIEANLKGVKLGREGRDNFFKDNFRAFLAFAWLTPKNLVPRSAF